MMRKAFDVLLHFFEAATALLGSEGGGGRGSAGTALSGQECIGKREVTINMLLGGGRVARHGGGGGHGIYHCPRWKQHPSSQQKRHGSILCKDGC